MTVLNHAVGDELLAFLKRNLDQTTLSTSDEDLMSKYVSVKDIAKFYNALGSDEGFTAEELWGQLKKKLELRQAKDVGEEYPVVRSPAPDATLPSEENEDIPAEEEEYQQEEEDPEEVARLEAKAARKLTRKLERERLENERLAQEEAEVKAARKAARNAQKYTDENPLLSGVRNAGKSEVEPEETEENLLTRKRPPVASDELMNRTYTPKCPNCSTRFSRAPPGWNCSMCLRRYGKEIKCWQPDEQVKSCATCSKSVGRFTRHHCRNCGRVVCGKCSEKKALIPAIGFDSTPVKVCVQCMDELVPKSPLHQQAETCQQ